MQDSDDYQTLSEQLVDQAPPDLGDLQSALARLPERARIIFVLHALEGYRQESIAKAMGITTGTVKAQFHRASQLQGKTSFQRLRQRARRGKADRPHFARDRQR